MKYQICVSGAASGKTVVSSYKLAYRLGTTIVSKGKTLLTGATVGLPHYAAMGAVSVPGNRGLSIGFSPAESFKEHVSVYKLPFKEFDYINFTGLAYAGRDVYLVRSADAVITVGGRMGSLHELVTGLESHKICGVLLGSGGLADYVPTIMKNIESPFASSIIYSHDPDELVDMVIKALDEKYRMIDSQKYNIKGGDCTLISSHQG